MTVMEVIRAAAPFLAGSAGILILCSMLPDILLNFRNPARANGQDWRRPAMQMAGYTLWVSYGLLRGDVYLAIVTGVALALSIILFVQARRATIPLNAK